MNSTPDGAGDGTDSESTGGYVHDPAAFDDEGERVETSGAAPPDSPHPDAAERSFDWRGWALVGVMLFSFVVAPLVVYLRPSPLPWRVTLIVMPLLPALLLGATAVWATTRP